MAPFSSKKIIARKNRNYGTSKSKRSNMNLSDEDIDKLFQEAANKQESPLFSDEYFAEIEHLLPRKKKNKFVYLFSLLPLTALIVYLFNFHSTSNSSLSAINTEISQIELTEELSIKNQNQNYVDIIESKPFKISQNNLTILNNKIKKENIILSNNTEHKVEDEIESSNSEITLNTKKPSFIELDFNKELGYFRRIKLKATKSVVVSLAYGLMQDLNKQSNAMNTVLNFGTSYRKMYSNNFGIEAGLNLQTILGNNTFEKKTSVYSYRKTNYSQTINYKTVISLDLPITLIKKLNKNMFSISMIPQVNMGAVFNLKQFKNDEILQMKTIMATDLA
jgi:hypothetical protein